MQAAPPPDFMVFTGNANPALAADIARSPEHYLRCRHSRTILDGEVTVEITIKTCGLATFLWSSPPAHPPTTL